MRKEFLSVAVILFLATGAWADTLPPNQPPVVDVGPDRFAYTGNWGYANLHGTVYDPDGDSIMNWTWEVVSQPPGGHYWLAGCADWPDCAFYATIAGDYVVSLTVWDGHPTGIGQDFVTVHFRDNVPPEAIATADRLTILPGGAVCFDGSHSYDPESGPLLYYWAFGDGTPPARVASVCHLFQDVGRYSVTFGVTDEANAMDAAVFSIDVDQPTTVPEPASTMLLGTGLFGLLGTFRRKMRK